MGVFLNFQSFLGISGVCQKQALPRNMLEKLGEVFKNNFLTALWDLERRMKAGAEKSRSQTISERSLIYMLSVFFVWCCNIILDLASVYDNTC